MVATFEVFKSLTWLIATMLDSTNIEGFIEYGCSRQQTLLGLTIDWALVLSLFVGVVFAIVDLLARTPWYRHPDCKFLFQNLISERSFT